MWTHTKKVLYCVVNEISVLLWLCTQGFLVCQVYVSSSNRGHSLIPAVLLHLCQNSLKLSWAFLFFLITLNCVFSLFSHIHIYLVGIIQARTSFTKFSSHCQQSSVPSDSYTGTNRYLEIWWWTWVFVYFYCIFFFFLPNMMLSPGNGRLSIFSPYMFSVQSPTTPLSALQFSGLLSGIITNSSAGIFIAVMSRRPAATAPTAGRRGLCKILEI